MTSEGTTWKPVALLSVSHGLVDLCQGMVPALLLFLVKDLGLSYAQGAGLLFATASASSVVQPLFGVLADRFSFRWLLPLSVLLTGAGLALGTQSSNYPVLFVALMVSGLGVAAFHPEAARQVHRLAKLGRTAEMSVFAVGGNIGFATAPLVTAGLMKMSGRPGLLLILLPIGVMAALLFVQIPAVKPALPSRNGATDRHPAASHNWAGFVILCAVTICRSILFVGFNAFLAFYWMSRWSVSATTGAIILAVFLGFGVGGTLLGGWLADRYGRRAMLCTGFATAAVLLPLLLAMTDLVPATLFLVLLGVAFYVPSSILVVLGQAYLPHRVGVASGVTLGLGVSMGGMVAPLLGKVADHHGVQAVLLVLEAILAVALLLALALPRPPRISQESIDGERCEEMAREGSLTEVPASKLA